MIDPAIDPAIDPIAPGQAARLALGPDGTVTAVDETFLRWTGRRADDLIGTARFSSLLTAGGRIYHETHFAPLLLLQGEVREVAFDLVRVDGTPLAVIVHATLTRDADGAPERIDVTVLDATVRRSYERELLRARRDAERAEREIRDIAEALQRSLLERADLTTSAVAVETRYRPAVDRLEVGGDWHDAFLLDEGRVGVSVGDIVGKGIRAACAMGQVRSALRALAGVAGGPGAALRAVDRFVGSVPDAFASTAVYAEIDLATSELRYTAAGHPPPVLVRADGSSEILWGGRSVPIGTIAADRVRPEATVALTPGDRLVLYTDGLCERRGRGPDEGFSLVAHHAVRLRAHPIGEMADQLVEAMLDRDEVRDDTCVLVLEIRVEK
ncbi:MAG: SpoIIE family protein phosphatase [Ilumatobacteraceae bacterium]|nr:SpoIIE family protein phosphatase [Ilumatobacteraceae bacterium]